jgi:hypothetical protein
MQWGASKNTGLCTTSNEYNGLWLQCQQTQPCDLDPPVYVPVGSIGYWAAFFYAKASIFGSMEKGRIGGKNQPLIGTWG